MSGKERQYDGNAIRALCVKLSFDQWANMTGVNYAQYEGGKNGTGSVIDRGTYAILRIYDRSQHKVDPATLKRPELQIEEGCKKYDKLYNENQSWKYLWADVGYTYGSSHVPVNPPSGYPTGFTESKTIPATGFTIMADISASDNTRRMPRFKSWSRIGNSYYDRKTKSGYSELRDGVFTVIPVIRGTSNNIEFVKEWYKRKRVGLFFCGGVLNYSYIDNWLHGLLYFFKFNFRIKWDDQATLDLNQRGSKFPRELIFFNILDNRFYYRSTPYNPTIKVFTGQKYSNYLELLHPTTFYDVGVRDEFLYEICYDPRVDPTCSVIRDITVSSYQDPGYVLEHAINYKMDSTNAKIEVKDFFSDANYSFGQVLDGDITQLISINCEAGIAEFDLDSPQYFLFNGEFLDPEDPIYSNYFHNPTGSTSWGPTPIDFKLDENGRFVRLCLNNRLGDYSQKVPFFLWDKRGEGFGAGGNLADKQRWDRNAIASQKLQRIVSVSNAASIVTNYIQADGEEEYLLKPMTIDHDTFVYNGNFTDMLERLPL